MIQNLNGESGKENPILCEKHLKTLRWLLNASVKGFSNKPKKKKKSSTILTLL